MKSVQPLSRNSDTEMLVDQSVDGLHGSTQQGLVHKAIGNLLPKFLEQFLEEIIGNRLAVHENPIAIKDNKCGGQRARPPR